MSIEVGNLLLIIKNNGLNENSNQAGTRADQGKGENGETERERGRG